MMMPPGTVASAASVIVGLVGCNVRFAQGGESTRNPGIGPVTALAYVASLDDVTRFASAHQVAAYLGLVPSEHSSGERQHRGRITKRGNPRVRWLLVEAGWRILRSRDPEAAALRAWAERIATRRGKRIAVVALARRLAGILFAMWRDRSAYQQTTAVQTAA